MTVRVSSELLLWAFSCGPMTWLSGGSDNQGSLVYGAVLLLAPWRCDAEQRLVLEQERAGFISAHVAHR